MLLSKKRQSRRALALWLGVMVLVVMFTTGVAYLILYSELFKVADFEIEGVRLENNKRTVMSALAMQNIHSRAVLGILGDDNTLFWALGEKDEAVNRHILPTVGKVQIDVNLLKRSVHIAIEEKQLFGVICASENECYGFDESGFVFARAPRVEGSLIVKIEDPNERPLVLGEMFLSRPHWLRNMFDVLNTVEESGLPLTALVLRDLQLQEWEATLPSGLVLYFDFNNVPEDLNAVLASLGEQVNFSRLKYLDFRVPNRIYYK